MILAQLPRLMNVRLLLLERVILAFLALGIGFSKRNCLHDIAYQDACGWLPLSLLLYDCTERINEGRACIIITPFISIITFKTVKNGEDA
jgi:hypothetical protein